MKEADVIVIALLALIALCLLVMVALWLIQRDWLVCEDPEPTVIPKWMQEAATTPPDEIIDYGADVRCLGTDIHDSPTVEMSMRKVK